MKTTLKNLSLINICMITIVAIAVAGLILVAINIATGNYNSHTI